MRFWPGFTEKPACARRKHDRRQCKGREYGVSAVGARKRGERGKVQNVAEAERLQNDPQRVRRAEAAGQQPAAKRKSHRGEPTVHLARFMRERHARQGLQQCQGPDERSNAVEHVDGYLCE